MAKQKTFRQQFDEAIACKTPEAAAAWLEREVDRFVEHPNCKKMTRDEIRQMVKSNLGYMAGYYDTATAQKIHTLFGANHPIFGEPGYHECMKPEEAFKMGVDAGRKENRRAIARN